MDTLGMSDLIFPMTEVLGQPAVRVQAPDGAQAIVLLHGGQVVSWIPASGREQLYLSPKAVAAPGQAVRGGVPVIFPQFEQRGPDTSLPRHGLARTRTWAVESSSRAKDHAQLTLALDDNAETRALWPHSFTLELTVSISGQRLDLELYAHNPGETSWPFAAALHTYLAVSDLSQARLQGLEGCHYVDSLTGGETVEDHPEKRFSSTPRPATCCCVTARAAWPSKPTSCPTSYCGTPARTNAPRSRTCPQTAGSTCCAWKAPTSSSPLPWAPTRAGAGARASCCWRPEHGQISA
jgi:D-hexose-6-phosphate mutarotase